MSIKTFNDQGTIDIAYGKRSRAAEKKLPLELHENARIKLAQLDASENILELRNMRSLNLEKLKGDRKPRWSIRINRQYRITFIIKEKDVWDVLIEDYH